MRRAMGLAGVGLVLAFASLTTLAQREAPYSDKDFVTKVASSGLHEVELGNLAKNQASSPDVKKFAERMVADHGKANEALKKAAAEAGITLPAKMLDEHQKHITQIRNLKGADFDRAYMKHMVESHTSGEKLFTQASKEATNPRLKEFATKTLPTIQEHLKIAKQINEGLGK
jgi:putative membrane protein